MMKINEKYLEFWMFSASDLNVNHGPVVHFIEVALALHKHNIPIRAFVPKYNKIIRKTQFNVVYTKKIIPIVSRAFSYQIELILYLLCFIFFKKRPTHFYIRQSSYMIIPQIISKIFNIKSIIELNGISLTHSQINKRNKITTKVIEWIESFSLKYSDYVVTVTEGLSLCIQRYYNIKKDKIFVISNGVNVEKFKRIEEPEFNKNDILNKDIDDIIVYLGTLERWQGVDLLIKAIKKLSKNKKNFIVLMIGSGTFEKKIIQEVFDEELSNYFLFLGEKSEDEIINYLSLCSIGVLPIYCKEKLFHDLSPMKLYTYLAMSLPVVATAMKGTEILKRENCGIIVDVNNAESFSDSIQFLLDNYHVRKEMSENARKLAEKEFDWMYLTGKLLNLIKM